MHVPRTRSRHSFKRHKRSQHKRTNNARDWALGIALGSIIIWQFVPQLRSAATVATHSREQLAAIQASAYFPNCDAARAAGAAPIHIGEPGYRDKLDADGDGVACEPYY